MKTFYVVSCVLGVALPYGQFLPWVLENGLDVLLLGQEAFQSRVGAFAWLDVIVSALALLGFICAEGRRLDMRRLWVPVVGTLGVGVSLGLPLFLLMRELHLEQRQAVSLRSTS